jgi:hypothetical protein
MKSEHRHDLQTNDLGKYAEKAALYIDRHGNRLMMGICVAAIVLSAGIFYWRTQSSKQERAWADLSIALNSGKPDVLQSVWDDNKGSIPGLWAKVYEGEILLGQGVQASFRNLEKATDDLKKARSAFQVVVDERGAPAEIRERALLGLGRALESLSDGSEAEAVKAYETLVKDFPKSEFKDDAQSRIDVLKSEKGEKFYAWFSKYTRPKIADKLPRDQGGSGIDEEMFNLDHNPLKGKAGKKASDDDEDLTFPDEMEKKDKTKPQEPDTEEPVEEPPTKSDGEDKPAPETKPQTESDVKPE